uniref:MORN repeat-containing protein 5 n=1 Tax=Glossina brevipalpis TaxID=37001 RepID=A0A1A9W0L9_9MUSC
MQPFVYTVEKSTPFSKFKKRLIENVSTTNNFRFLTGSRYTGTWANAVQCMEGYGIYNFPDGSEYRGYFLKGFFHGKGLLHLAKPYCFTFRGIFHDGRLNEMLDMWFDDELRVEAVFKGWEADFSNWRYCNEDDRRYLVEHIEGLNAVGPLLYATPRKPSRFLDAGTFDVEEGIYKPTRKIVTKRPNPFPSRNFVANREERKWIMKNCRCAFGIHADRISPRVHSKLMDTNILNQQDFEEGSPKCHFDVHKYHTQHYKGICRDSKKRMEASKKKNGVKIDKMEKSKDLEQISLSSGSDQTGLVDTTSSCCSFSHDALVVDQSLTLKTTTEMDYVTLDPSYDKEETNLVMQ